jgi:hypothetical protein
MRYRHATIAGPSTIARTERWLVAGLPHYCERRRKAGEAGGRDMAPARETGRTRQKGSTRQVDAGRGRRTVAQEIGRGGEPTRVDIDPWGAFFEDFWGEAAESGSTDRPDGGREPAKGTRAKGIKLGR